jgi:hypothetical protein
MSNYFIYFPRFSDFPSKSEHADKWTDLCDEIVCDFSSMVFGSTEKVGIDFEDFFECAVQLTSAIKFSASNGWVAQPGVPINENRWYGQIQESSVLFCIGNGRFDTSSKYFPNNQVIRGERDYAPSRYDKLNIFYTRANRKCEMASFVSPDKDAPLQKKSFVSVAQKLVSEGHSKLLFKVMKQVKSGIYVIDFSQCKTDADIQDAIFSSEFAWASVRFEGDDDAVLVQEFSDIKKEYRMVVLDNKLICGAGTVPEFTPINNTGDIFDRRVKESLNENIVIQLSNIELADFIRFAEDTIQNIKNESNFKNYILDIGVINGTLGIIEINPLDRFGLYAMNTKALILGYEQLLQETKSL